MALSRDEVERFINADKGLRKNLSWSIEVDKRKASTEVFGDGMSAGFLRCICGFAARHWTFRLEIGKEEVLRWDFISPDEHQSHSNPIDRPADYLRKVRGDHEHLWRDPPGDMRLATPLTAHGPRVEHHEAFVAFCQRARIDAGAHYRSPPPVQKEFSLDLPK